MYIKSVYTGQVYKVEAMPAYEGYVEATEQEYLDYLKKMGF